MILSRLVLVLAVACRTAVGEAGATFEQTAVDTMRFGCEPGPRLAIRKRTALPFALERLLTADEDLLIVARGGALYRFDGDESRPTPILDNGKDYDARDGVLARLEPDRIALFRYGAGREPAPLRSLAAARHEASLALSARSIYLHSPVDPKGVLVVERDRRSGGMTGSFLPVERSLFRLLTGDLDRVLEDVGDVRALERGFVFVPWIRDPIEIVGPGKRTSLFLGNGERGEIRTVSERRSPLSIPCPVCPHRQEVETRQEVRRLYGGAAFGADALWILRLDPSGVDASTMIRYGLGRSAEADVRSWTLAGEEPAPRALAVWRERIVVADDRGLGFYDLPPAGTGTPCTVPERAIGILPRR